MTLQPVAAAAVLVQFKCASGTYDELDSWPEADEAFMKTLAR